MAIRTAAGYWNLLKPTPDRRLRRPSLMRRGLAFEHCEPRLALSAAGDAGLFVDSALISAAAEGGFVHFTAINSSIPVQIQFVGGQQLGGGTILFDLDGVGREAPLLNTTNEALSTSIDGLVTSGFPMVDGPTSSNSATLIYDNDFRPMPIAAATETELPDEGGLIAALPWPAENSLAKATRADLALDADASNESQSQGNQPIGLAPRATREVEGMRGRAVVFEVASQTTTSLRPEFRPATQSPNPDLSTSPVGHSNDKGPDHAAAALEAANAGGYEKVAAQSVDFAGFGNRNSDAAFDSALSLVGRYGRTSGEKWQIAHGYAKQFDGTPHGVAAAIACAAESNSAAHDEALAQELAAPTDGIVAAILDPTRNRPLLGLVAASLLLSARSWHNSRPADDRSPTEMPPRRKFPK